MDIVAPKEICSKCKGFKTIYAPFGSSGCMITEPCPVCQGQGEIFRPITEYEQYLIDKIKSIILWKLIWSAPRDGTKILACDFNHKNIITVWWKKDTTFTDGGYWCISGTMQAIYGMTHWHPIPDFEVE